MIKTLLVLLALAAIPIAVRGTPQVPDRLVYKGNTYPLLANPLESFYQDAKSRPKFFSFPGQELSGNWRGYVATWEIADGKLYLIEIDSWICASGTSEDCQHADLATLFGKRYRNGKVKADWYSGELRLANGRVLRYPWIGYSAIFEHEIVLSVKAGRLAAERHIDNSKRELPSEQDLLEQELEKLEQKSKEKPKPPHKRLGGLAGERP